MTAGNVRRARRNAALCSCSLALYNNILPRWAGYRRHPVPANLLAAAVLVRSARRSGLTWAELGLAWRCLGRGAVTGLAAAAGVTGGLLAASRTPAGRRWSDDRRFSNLPSRDLAERVLWRIPLGTVLWEEAAFRGVLLASLRRVASPGAALALECGVFGLWHVTPALDRERANRGEAGAGQASAVAATVLSTGAAGLVLSWLRLRGGHLLGSALPHYAANVLGTLLAARGRPAVARRAAAGTSGRRSRGVGKHE